MDSLSVAKRDAVTRLCQAQAAGLMSVEQFEQRYALIQDASTPSVVASIVADLTAPDPWPDPASSPVSPTLPVARSEAPPVAVRLPSVLGTLARAGDWTVPEVLEMLVVLGESTLDFRDAVFTTETVVIDLSVYFGSVTLIVPPGTEVETDCREFLASAKKKPRKRRRAVEPNGLLVLVRGFLFMAELSIKEKEPTGDGPMLLEPSLPPPSSLP